MGIRSVQFNPPYRLTTSLVLHQQMGSNQVQVELKPNPN